MRYVVFFVLPLPEMKFSSADARAVYLPQDDVEKILKGP
jgi:hypothetical protein